MDYIYHILVMACLYVILATSFNVVIGLAGMFALSHAAFYAVGAYATAILTTQYGLPFPVPLLAGIVMAAVIGGIAALPALRVGGHYLVIITLALQVIVEDTLRNAQDITGGPDGISGIPRIRLFDLSPGTPGSFLVFAAIMAVLCFLVTRAIANAPFGRALRAMRENEIAAQAIGKNTVLLKFLAFLTSASLASVAGSMLAQYITFVSPASFTAEETIFILAMVILGGTGNLWGSAVGAVFLVVLPELLKFVDLPDATADLIRNVLYGLILILILRFRPGGLIPENYRPKVPRDLVGAPAAFQPSAAGAAKGEVTLAGKDLSKSFGGIVAARSLTIELHSGMVTGLIGPNGAGKTTAFNLLTGFLPPTAGEVFFRGRRVSGMRPHRIVRAGIARSFQDLKLFRGMSVLENVLVALPNQSGDSLLNVFLAPRRVAAEEHANIGRALGILDFVGLVHKAGEDANNLSYAEEKLLVIARLLATDAEVILLDEPLSGLAPNTLEEVLPIIRKLAAQGRTVCLIEHNLEVIREACDVVNYVDAGEVIARGEPEELMRDARLLERYIQ